MKYASRITLLMLAVAALPASLLHWRSFEAEREARATAADRALTGNADEAAALLDAARRRWLDGVRSDARLPGMDAILRSRHAFHDGMGTGFFAAIAGRDPVNVGAVGLLDLEGRVVLDSRALNLGRHEGAEPYVRAVLADGQPLLYGPYRPAGDRVAGLFAVALVRDAEERPAGLLRVRYEPSVLGQVMGASLGNTEGLSASLIDGAGRVLWGVGPEGEAPLPPLPDRTGGTAAFDLGRERVATARVPASDWRVVVRQPLTTWQAPQRAAMHTWLQQSVLLLALLLTASLLLGRWIARPLAAFSEVARRMAGGDFQPVPAWRGAVEARALGEALDQLAARLRETIGALSAELEQRRATEQALRESRAEFRALVEQLPGAVYRCANAADWPMDYLSPQIEAITGYTPEALLAGDGTGFTALVLPEYRKANEEAVERSLASGGRFELRYRLRHRDGGLRWIWELGCVHLDEAGQPARLTGLLFDISEREAANEALSALRGSVEAAVGGDYFRGLAAGLARLTGAEVVIVGRFLGVPPSEVCSLAVADRAKPRDSAHFAIAGTPTEAVLRQGHLEIDDGVQAAFPTDVTLARRDIRAYRGIRLDDSHGRPIGVIALLDRHPFAAGKTIDLVLELFRDRAAAELERLIAEEHLQRLAETLENRVAERTRELQEANATLSQAMDQLVQREKLASLGSLVAGLAHELNTPIGNALTVSTALGDLYRQFSGLLASGQLKRSALEQFLAENAEAAGLIERNLERAATLISHFKQVAVDQASMRRRRFELGELVQDVLSTLSPRLKRSPHRVEVAVPKGLSLDSYPGPLEQVLTNLLENSLVHAWDEGQAGCIHIHADALGEGEEAGVRLVYEDDGRGIPKESRQRVFDPFFTTRLGQGGSGLGLYLVYNLVHGRLGGRIRLLDREGGGVRFQIDLPAKAPAGATEPEA
ncbi:MAG: ATP-binding protein [Silanimonas lenta]